MLAHDVYFNLHDTSPAAKAQLAAAAKQCLGGLPGIVFFAVGTLAEDLKRPVNDRDFDVALHVVFQDRAAHDAYQQAPAHLQFGAENKARWKRIRVFDSIVES